MPNNAILGIGRGGGDDEALREVDLLLHLAVVDHQGARLLAGREPLQQLRQHHRLEIARDAHGSR